MYEPAGAYWLTMESRSLWSQQDGDNFLNDGYLRYQDEKDLPLESLVAKVGARLRTPTGGPGSWTDVKPSGSAPAVRFGEALVSLGTGGKVFMFGGATDERHPLGDPWLYDTLADTWSRLPPPVTRRRPTGERPQSICLCPGG